jgi:hypothetical protein
MQYGYRILPDRRLPDTSEEFEQTIQQYLSKASLVIQIMGARYGDEIKGTRFSMPDFQNRIIGKYQKEATDPFQRFIWVPQYLRINDQRQSLILNKVRRDEADTNTEIIESPLETFKTVLATKLHNVSDDHREKDEGNMNVFLITEENESDYVNNLKKKLTQAGMNVLLLDYSKQDDIYTRYLEALRKVNAVIIYQQKENKFWLNSKLRDLIKSPGLGRLHSLEKVLLITALLPDAQLIRMIKSDVEKLENTQPDVEQIITKLKTE